MEVGIREAKTKLSQLVKAALAGEEVFLTNRGERKIQLRVVEKTGGVRAWGSWAGKVNLYEEWDSAEEDKRIEETFEHVQEENADLTRHERAGKGDGRSAVAPRRKARIKRPR